ncbi:hypothetical protein JN535_04105 [Cellulosimicrobium cellulans]|uniref:hypothetical protein n=1 Tax=Cellulosimicrobium cellulans TaxID=1710 RepID=UPI001963756D|nr:hypothetical protein [Cellulosimicrobium cellulans]MBN0039357.1 hypothetical protein [Cellulosimicrobium cellulans]
MSETTQTTTATTATKPLAGLDELLPPGAAQRVRAEHDAAVGTLQALLAEARQDADRYAELYAVTQDRVEVLTAELADARECVNLPTVQDIALADVVDAARAVVDAGRGTPGSTERRKRLERALATVVEPLAVVVASARWTDRYGRVGAVEALTALEDAVRALPAEEVRRG